MHTPTPPTAAGQPLAADGRSIAVEMRSVSKSFGDRVALRVDNLQLKSGGSTALIGPNGAGKSTFVKLVAGLLRPSEAGVLNVLGRDLAGSTPRSLAERRIGLVTNSSQLYGTLTAR